MMTMKPSRPAPVAAALLVIAILIGLSAGCKTYREHQAELARHAAAEPEAAAEPSPKPPQIPKESDFSANSKTIRNGSLDCDEGWTITADRILCEMDGAGNVSRALAFDGSLVSVEPDFKVSGGRLFWNPADDSVVAADRPVCLFGVRDGGRGEAMKITARTDETVMVFPRGGGHRIIGSSVTELVKEPSR